MVLKDGVSTENFETVTIVRMEDRIYFNDKENELKGPFTERQVQAWYRKGWFDNSFPFFFTRGDERPSDDDNGTTLALLRSINGSGCPFFKSDENGKISDREKNLENMEKEIAELHQQFDAILRLKKILEGAEIGIQNVSTRSVTEETPNPHEKVSSGTSEKNEEPVKEVQFRITVDKNTTPNVLDVPVDQATKIPRPESISDEVWQRYYELGNSVADFILDSFAVYASQDFASWDKHRVSGIIGALGEVKGRTRVKRRNRVCEYILVERLKQKEFFRCESCQMTLFNYKQVLIHFMSQHHEQKRTAAAKLCGIDVEMIFILDEFTKLPETLLDSDSAIEDKRFKQYGYLSPAALDQSVFTSDVMAACVCFFARDLEQPLDSLETVLRRAQLVTPEDALSNAKSDLGRSVLEVLDEFIGQNPTDCIYCGINTGDQEGLYAHLISYRHLQKTAAYFERHGRTSKFPFRFCPITFIVNVHRKDLI